MGIISSINLHFAVLNESSSLHLFIFFSVVRHFPPNFYFLNSQVVVFGFSFSFLKIKSVTFHFSPFFFLGSLFSLISLLINGLINCSYQCLVPIHTCACVYTLHHDGLGDLALGGKKSR